MPPGKRTIKFGGKSGILPRLRPIFKTPIRPKNDHELAEDANIEQGYAENVPLPKKRGFKFQRTLTPKPVISVEERIRKTIDETTPKVDVSKLSEEEKWKHQVGEIRRQHLREAYLKEHERLKKIDELENIKHEKEKEKQQLNKQHLEESEASKLTIPTMEDYLKGPIVRQRTFEEQTIIDAKRVLNRKMTELELKEEKANELLELYHASSKFIINEEQLQKAIIEAFQSDINKFENAQLSVKDKMRGLKDPSKELERSENMFLDSIVGELNGKPGLDIVKDTIDGQIEKLRREAELAINKD
ncbi:37S ribosomal protein Pet123p, mitochondrial [[Candida] jaroonii]|uniref:37S ribosomal protein Pet123p, mitochondrial n=1 Tax=[Candida] jaroonii TaxID=467808 RepID=A0ACA9Y4M6_9ASCO|nr:37S ribosomal protein Pet123p, mitochondrial [[Candida] jaroonii]